MASTAQSATESGQPLEKRRRVDRVVAACDLCKKRKVKCDGEQPCAYCQRKGRAETCTFTAPKVRGARSAGHTPSGQVPVHANPQTTPRRRSDDGAAAIGTSLSPTISRDEHPEDTAVPLEGRILRDAQGKVIQRITKQYGGPAMKWDGGDTYNIVGMCCCNNTGNSC